VSIGPQDRSLLVRHDNGGVSIVDMIQVSRIDVPTPGDVRE
jgi:hypothetical protein